MQAQVREGLHSTDTGVWSWWGIELSPLGQGRTGDKRKSSNPESRQKQSGGGRQEKIYIQIKEKWVKMLAKALTKKYL